MPLSVLVLTKADAALAVLLTALATRQAGVKARTGKYRQLRVQDAWGIWEAIKPDSAVVACYVNEYLAPSGPGYEVVAQVTEAGVVYRRVVNVGPEKERTAEWAPVPSEALNDGQLVVL